VKVITCIGLIGAGTLTLSGCVGRFLFERPHHGGSGTPIYITQPTEQEAKAEYPVDQEPLEFILLASGLSRRWKINPLSYR